MNLKKIGFGAIASAGFVVGAAVSSVPAQAATFNFSGPLIPDLQSSFTFTQGGLSVTATAERGNSPANVVQSTEGLGVFGSLPNTGLPLQIDGTLRTLDKLNLQFSNAVKILSVTFGRVGFTDSFTLSSGVSQITSGALNGTLPLSLLDLGIDTQSFASLPFGTSFSFSVPNTIAGANLSGPDYTILGLEVQEVPTPALLPGLLALGAGVLRKRKTEVAEELSEA